MAMFNVLKPLQNVSLLFTKEQLSDIIAWFDSNSKPYIIEDEEPVNVITVEKLIQFLDLKKYHRRSFHYPSYAEIMNMIEKLKAGTTRVITKDQFIYVLNKWILMPDIKHELKLAFKVFDSEKRNFLEIDEMKVIVTRYADVFNENETRELLRDANVRGDGNVFYEDFVESLFSVAPELYQTKAEYLYENPDEDPTFFFEPVIEDKSPTPPTTQVEVKKPSKKAKKK
ncbi:calmodulin-like [Melitaea cinxia]|uniref:calmodulin-like n=1 Tax=Melitaea cinxia TaxID=113334 RepID=UPI001E273C40|nr:calmodulin-like [Melitaea cinxia]